MGAMASQITSPKSVYSTVYLGADRKRKNQSSASLAFVRGIHRWPVNSPHKWPVTRKMFPSDDVIMLPWAIPICPYGICHDGCRPSAITMLTPLWHESYQTTYKNTHLALCPLKKKDSWERWRLVPFIFYCYYHWGTTSHGDNTLCVLAWIIIITEPHARRIFIQIALMLYIRRMDSGRVIHNKNILIFICCCGVDIGYSAFLDIKCLEYINIYIYIPSVRNKNMSYTYDHGQKHYIGVTIYCLVDSSSRLTIMRTPKFHITGHLWGNPSVTRAQKDQ